MSMQNHATPNSARPGAGLPTVRTRHAQRSARTEGRQRPALVCGILLGLVGLAGCSDDQARRKNSEMVLDPPAAPAPAAAPAKGPDAAPATAPLAGSGRRYRVAVGSAYFFDKPEQSTPNGRYLRRGDTFYGEGETNGFVRTGFVQPNGAAGTAWLKAQELTRLYGGPAARPARPAPAPLPAAAAPDYQPDEPVATARKPADAGATPARTAVVQVDRSYFYHTPNLTAPRRAFCQRGDKVRLGESRGDAVYVTFTNWEKVTTTGWMRKSELRQLQ